jgi:hypothetical protein
VNASNIKTLQMDIPNCLKVKPFIFIPEYVDFFTNTLPNLGTLVLTTNFYAAYGPGRWVEEYRALLHTAASIIVAHKTLRSAIWTETCRPTKSMKPFSTFDLGNRQICLRATLSEAETGLGAERGQNRGLVLDCAMICKAGWAALGEKYEARMWAINADVPDELIG